jgi:hypothetical protein
MFKRCVGPTQRLSYLDGLDLEMETDEGEDQALEVLDQVVETPKHRKNPSQR